jgi:hypothetical protein
MLSYTTRSIITARMAEGASSDLCRWAAEQRERHAAGGVADPVRRDKRRFSGDNELHKEAAIEQILENLYLGPPKRGKYHRYEEGSGGGGGTYAASHALNRALEDRAAASAAAAAVEHNVQARRLAEHSREMQLRAEHSREMQLRAEHSRAVQLRAELYRQQQQRQARALAEAAGGGFGSCGSSYWKRP